MGEKFGHSFPYLRCGSRKLLASQSSRGWNDQVEGRNHHQGPGEDSEKLSDELLARVRSEQISGFQVRQQVSRRSCRSSGDAGGHEIGRDAGRSDHAVE